MSAELTSQPLWLPKLKKTLKKHRTYDQDPNIVFFSCKQLLIDKIRQGQKRSKFYDLSTVYFYQHGSSSSLCLLMQS